MVLPSDERTERGDEGREGSAVVANTGGEGMVSGGFGHVSAEKMEPVGDVDTIDSISKAALGTVRPSSGGLLLIRGDTNGV